VIDHAAKPAGEAGLGLWREAIAPLADHPGLWVKLSGLLTELPAGAVPRAVETLAALAKPRYHPTGQSYRRRRYIVLYFGKLSSHMTGCCSRCHPTNLVFRQT
jgi:hypothetical protein